MKCGGADDGIEGLAEWKVKQIAGHQAHSRSELREMLSRRAQHVLRKIHGYHAAMGQHLQKIGGQATGAASGIQHALIPAET